MHIKSIRLKNFKSFQHAEMFDIPRFCVLVGANGSGKEGENLAPSVCCFYLIHSQLRKRANNSSSLMLDMGDYSASSIRA